MSKLLYFCMKFGPAHELCNLLGLIDYPVSPRDDWGYEMRGVPTWNMPRVLLLVVVGLVFAGIWVAA